MQKQQQNTKSSLWGRLPTQVFAFALGFIMIFTGISADAQLIPLGQSEETLIPMQTKDAQVWSTNVVATTDAEPSEEEEGMIQWQEIIAFKKMTKYSPLISDGNAMQVQEGELGIVDVLAEENYDEYGEADHIVAQRFWNRYPRNDITIVGGDVPVSPLDFDVPMDENGKPLSYRTVLTEQIATGYSARPGAKTASGLPAVVGHVAVNPKIIPYGTRLYITSADNSFVYGYAIAADTGTGLLNGIIDIDLFYETYQESALNGRKYLEIYIL